MQWESARQDRQAASREAGQAAAAQLQADAAELQQCCVRLEAWLAAKRQEASARDSLTESLGGKGTCTPSACK